MKVSKVKHQLISGYEFFYETQRMLRLRIKYRMKIMSPERTIRYIKKNQCSIARFGDGEFDLIFGARDLGFQKRLPEFSIALRNILENKNPNLLLCIPRSMNTVKG